jgi:hypothetical protein
MKRIKVIETKVKRVQCDARRFRYKPPKAKPPAIKRVRVPPAEIEADEFVQYHLAKISAAKETERTSWAAIADYLVASAPADLE